LVEHIIIKGIKVKASNYRKIAEIYFNKHLEPGEVVHHIDGNRNNNAPINLVILKAEQHKRIHNLFRPLMGNDYTTVKTRVPSDTVEFLNAVVAEDLQWNAISTLMRDIIHYWVEEQRAKKLEQLEKAQ